MKNKIARMKIRKINGKRLLWGAMTGGLLGIVGCSSVGSTASKSPSVKPNIIASDTYDAGTRDFNPAWPYGQESR